MLTQLQNTCTRNLSATFGSHSAEIFCTCSIFVLHLFHICFAKRVPLAAAGYILSHSVLNSAYILLRVPCCLACYTHITFCNEIPGRRTFFMPCALHLFARQLAQSWFRWGAYVKVRRRTNLVGWGGAKLRSKPCNLMQITGKEN